MKNKKHSKGNRSGGVKPQSLRGGTTHGWQVGSSGWQTSAGKLDRVQSSLIISKHRVINCTDQIQTGLRLDRYIERRASLCIDDSRNNPAMKQGNGKLEVANTIRGKGEQV